MKTLQKIDKVLGWISNLCTWISGASLFGMALLITVNVVLRYVMHHAITGQQEVVELLMVFVVYFALAYSTRLRSHVRVDVVTNLMPKAARNICLGIMTWLCIVVTVGITWQVGSYGMTLLERGTATSILKLPYYPFYILIAVLCVLISVEFFVDGLKYFSAAFRAATHRDEEHLIESQQETEGGDES